MTCSLDSRREEVGNFRVEPPGLFRGRGEHPEKDSKVVPRRPFRSLTRFAGPPQLRVYPEDITINIAADAPIPVPNIPASGKRSFMIKLSLGLRRGLRTPTVTISTCYWLRAVSSMVRMTRSSSKSSKASVCAPLPFCVTHVCLSTHIERILADLRNKTTQLRTRATAMYFINVLALRAGNEKDEDEADTVDYCSLRCEHVTLEPPNHVIFDFLGKELYPVLQ